MDITIKRSDFSREGIFGTLFDSQGRELASTLEHAYLNTDGSYSPKIPEGTYTCVRGIHELGQIRRLETFEVTNVPGHSGVLFHMGNYNEDSSGCILVGEARMGNMITKSIATFGKFMTLQDGLDSFTLSVI